MRLVIRLFFFKRGTSFEESFPNYYKGKELDTQYISTNLESSTISEVVNKLPQIVETLIEKKGLVSYMQLFSSNNKSSNEILNDFIKKSENTVTENLQGKPLGEIGEITINQALNEGFKYVKPLKDQLDKGLEVVGLDLNACGNLVSFLFMYNAICKGHGYILRKYSPSYSAYEKLSTLEKTNLENIWVKSNNRFKLIAAPLLLVSLYTIKKITLTPKVNISIDINTGIEGSTNNNINKSIPF